MHDGFLFEEIVKPDNHAKRKHVVKDYSFKKKGAGLKPLKRNKHEIKQLVTKQQDDFDDE